MKIATTFTVRVSLPTFPKYMVGSVPGQCLHVRVTSFLQNATIAIVFDNAIYPFISSFFAFYFNFIASKSHSKNSYEKSKKLYNSRQIIIIHVRPM